MPIVSVVILNWNGQAFLEIFLPSVLASTYENLKIYVADNASTDDSIAFLEKNYPTIEIIRNADNYGFAKGYNEALKNVVGDYYVLLNSDVEVHKNWVEPIIKLMEKDIQIAVCQPKIRAYDDKEKFEYAGAAGGFIDSLGYPFCRGRIFDICETDKGQYDDVCPIFWASGAAMFVRAAVYKQMGGLDDDFFAHMEEIDLCWRIQQNGGIIKYIGNSTVYHVGGATLSNINPTKTFYNFRNSLLMLVKNIKSSKVWIILFIRLLMDGIAGLHFLIQGKWKHTLAIIKAHFSFYSLLPRYINKEYKIRKEIKYYHIKSIVWNYFIRKKRIFKELN